jgi:hypothetical protein
LSSKPVSTSRKLASSSPPAGGGGPVTVGIGGQVDHLRDVRGRGPNTADQLSGSASGRPRQRPVAVGRPTIVADLVTASPAANTRAGR